MREQSTIKFFDGTKSVSLNDLPKEAWEIIAGGRGSSEKVDKLFSTVAWLYRCVEIRAAAVASMPYEIKRNADVVYDSVGDDMPPKGLEWLTDLSEILQKIEAATVLGGRAYLERRPNMLGNRLLGFAWLLPWTVEPKFNDEGISHFIRRVKNEDRRLEVEDVVYLWPPDYSVELGPALNYPGRAVMQNAGVVSSMDLFLKGYFDRGMVKATLLKYKDRVSPEEGKRVKEWWQRVFSGVKNAFSTEVIRGDFEAMSIGEGIRDLRDNALTDKERESIASGLGVPQSKVTANAANFATKQSDDVMFLEDTIIPEWVWIARSLNAQVLHPMGYHLSPTPQKLRVLQEDENERSQALIHYTQAGMPLETAVSILGIHVPDDMPLTVAMPMPDDNGEVVAGTPGAVTEEMVLNGAQIQSALSIIETFSTGQLPRENAVFMVETFFNIPGDVAERLVPTSMPEPAVQPTPVQDTLAADEARRFQRWWNKRKRANPEDFESEYLSMEDKMKLIKAERLPPSDERVPPEPAGEEPTEEQIDEAVEVWDEEMPDAEGLLDAEIEGEEE